jgi:hypothetical protein
MTVANILEASPAAAVDLPMQGPGANRTEVQAGWPGVSKDLDRPHVAIYRFGQRQIGHVHGDRVADLTVPKAIQNALISDGLAQPHRGGFPAVVSYRIRGPEDVPGAVDHFRRSYERARAAAERRQDN